MDYDSDRRITIGAKVRPEIGLGIDWAVLAYPNLFTDRSGFIRTAVTRLLTELRLGEQPVDLQSQGEAPSEHGDTPRLVNRKENDLTMEVIRDGSA